MKKTFFASLLFFIIGIVLNPLESIAQSMARKDSVQMPHTETMAKRYKVRAVVKKVFREEKKIMLKHEKIKGVMPAMTMTFPVTNPTLLEGVEVGNKGIFTIMVYKGLPSVAGIKI